MKTVIEKIILNYFGTFINGIHKDKLSIDLFGGNFQLENISLNQEYFDSLNTPFKLTYSSIGKLNLQAPISKLSSAPVECVLDNIYAVFQFKEDNIQKEQLSAEQMFRLRKEQIEKHIREMFETYLKRLREKQDKKQDGMMAKLGKKIIDNLQLKIVNVHVRFQEKSSKQNKYSWGLTLEEIGFFTTDNQWKPAFVDRSAESSKAEKLYKKMNLKNFNIYWQSGAKQKSQKQIFITQMGSQAEKKAKMLQMIREDNHSIISITSQFKLIINPLQKLDVPLYQLSVELAPIKFQLERVQVSEMIQFAQKNMIKSEIILKKLSMKKKKSNQSLGGEQKKKFEGHFTDFVEDYIDKVQTAQNANQNQPIKQDDDQFEINAILKTIFSKVEQEQLLTWALKPIRSRVKLAREKELKKKKKGWFGGQYQLNEEQTKALQNFVEEVADSEDNSRPTDALFFSLQVMIHGGVFSFVDHKDTEDEEQILFQIGIIQSKLCKSQNDSLLMIQLGIKQISLDLLLPKYGSKSEKLKLNILMNDHKDLQKMEQKFIAIKFVKKIAIQQTKPTIKTDIEGQMKKIIFTYKKLYLKKFKSFFTFKNVKEQMKNETLKKWEQMKEKQQQGQNQENNENIVQQQGEVAKMFNIKVKIISPLFICPLSQDDCWCLSLGDLTIFSRRDQEKEIYPMKIQSAYFRYYANIKDCQEEDSQVKDPKKIFSLINDMNFQLIHNKYHHNSGAHTEICLPTFSVNFTEQQYKNLLSLQDIFKMDEQQSNFLETLKKQRIQVQRKMRYCGQMQKKNQHQDIDKWRPFYGILSGDFIHLYGSEKQLKCIERISLKHCRLEFNAENQTISIINQDGIIYITQTEHDGNIVQWKENLQKHLKQFLSVFDIVDEDMQDNFEESPRKRKQTEKIIVDHSHSKKTISVKINNISFNYQDQNNLNSIMTFQVNGLAIEQSQHKKIMKRKVLIQQLLITDFIYKYHSADPSKESELQSLMKTKNIQVNIEKDKNQENRKNLMKMKIPQIDINWKPDVLIILLQLVSKHFSKEKKLRVDDGQIKTRDQLINEVKTDKKFDFLTKEYQRNGQNRKVKQKRLNYAQKNKHIKQLLNFVCEIGEMNILMLHRQSHLTMFKLMTKNIFNEFILGENEKFVNGTVGVMELYEMTEYPKTSYKDDIGKECTKPYKIISPKLSVQKNNEPLIEYKWSSYEPFVLPNMERVNSFIYASINPITCEYFQQITFRAIDYILIQVVLLLNQPEMLIANQNLLDQLKKGKIDGNSEINQAQNDIVKVLFSEYEEIIKKIIDPYFMDLYIKCVNPSIIMKPQKHSNIFYRADFSTIEFSNRQLQKGDRFVKSIKGTQLQQILQYVYEEEYVIYGNDCKFYSIQQNPQKNREQLLFQPIKMQMILNKLILEDELNILYPELSNYDRSFYTKNVIPELVANNFTRHHYLLLNKLTNFNMVYDDNQDQLFIHNFKITKLLSPKPIYYELSLGRIYLAGKQDYYSPFLKQKQSQQEKITLDLFEVMMYGCKMVYQRNTDLNSSFKIVIGTTQVYGYEYPTPHPSVPKEDLKEFYHKHQNANKIHLMDIKSQDNEEQAMDLTIKMRTTGQKIIQMNIENIEVNLQLHLLQMIFEWSLLEDWVFPTVSIYANDITFHITIHNMSAWLQQQKNKKISRKQSKNSKMLEEQQNDDQNVRAFRLVGIFCYKFHRKAFYSQQHIEQQFKNGEISTNQINKMPQVSYMTILLNTQVENCLRGVESNSILMKRQVIQKITLNMIQKKHYKVASQKNFTIKTMSQRKMNLDRGLFKISFTDVMLMNEILASIGEERKYIDYVKNLLESQKQKLEEIPIQNSVIEKMGNSQSQEIMQEKPSSQALQLEKMSEIDEKIKIPVVEGSHQTQISSLQNFDLDIESISLYLINNCRQSFIPVFKLQINNASLSKVNTFKKNLIKGNLDVTANYFNTAIFKWQPVLEKVDIIFHQLIYKGPSEEEIGEMLIGKEGIKEMKQQEKRMKRISNSESTSASSQLSPQKKYNQNTFSSLETNQPVLINISKELMLSVKEIQSQWQKNKERKLESTENTMMGEKRNSLSQEYNMFNNTSIFLQHQQSNNGSDSLVEIFVSQYVIRNETGYPLQIYSHTDKKLKQKIPHMKQVNYSNDLDSLDNQNGNKDENLIGFSIINHHKYKFKRITHIPLDLNKSFEILPQIIGMNFDDTYKRLPRNSHLQIIPEIKDSKRFLTIRSTKSIQSYLDNKFERTVLPFDYDEKVKLYHQPHNGIEVSLYKELDNSKQKCRYIGNNGKLKILPKFLVYNFTPIPLKACSFYLMPGEFVGISENLTIQNMKWRDCKGVKVDFNEKLKEYYLYCEGYVIDYAGLFFEFNSGYDAKAFSHEFSEKGYKFNIYLLTDGQAKFKVRLKKNYKSKGDLKCSEMIKPAVGNETFYLQNPEGAHCDYQTYGYLTSFSTKEHSQYRSFKKVIEISPLYFLSNTTKFKLKVCQIGSCQSMTLVPGERLPFYWENKSKPKQIKIAAVSQNQMWGYSGPIELSHNINSLVVRKTDDISQYKILQTQVQITNTITFVHVLEPNIKNGTCMVLSNQVKGISFKIYQPSIFQKDHEMMDPSQYVFTVNPYEQVPFGYQLPLESRGLTMQAVFDPSYKKYEGCFTKPITLEDLETNLFEKHYSIYNKDNKRVKKILIKLSFHKNIKKLQMLEKHQIDLCLNKGQFICKIPRIGLSLIGYQEKVRKEIIAVFLQGIQFQTASQKEVTQFCLILRGMKIDNCLKIAPIFPVLLQSLITPQATFFINFMLVKDNYNSQLVHYFGLSINKFVLSITSEEIQCLQQNFNQITQAFNNKDSHDGSELRKFQLFSRKQIQPENLYFVQAEIHPLRANFSFKHVNDWGGKLLKTFAGIDECNISVDGKKIRHFSSKNIGEFGNHLMKHYQEGISKMLIPMIGNLSILGSPISLVQRIGSGFRDLVELPSEGFNVSPLEGGKGLAKGAGSLVKNTFQGALNSVQSVTGSVGNGLSTLVFDDSFNRQRQRIRNQKSEHVGQGLSNGLKSIANGVGRGITGLVTAPVEGAQESGIGGFFLGGIKGITGLVIKPVSGIFDATTKTFQGIKNTPSYISKSDAQKMDIFKRGRNPRIFYGINREFKGYDQDLSVCAKLLVDADKDKYQNLSWYGLYHLISVKEDKKPLIFLTYEYFVIYNYAKAEVMQTYRSEDIYQAKLQANNLVKVLMYDRKRKKMGHIDLKLKYAMGKKLISELMTISHLYRPVYGFDYELFVGKN